MANETQSADHLLTILKRLGPIEGVPEYRVEFRQRHADGLPVVVTPFWVDERREDGKRAGLHDVLCKTRRGEDAVVIGGFTNQFDAMRAMITAREAWEAIRPIERVYFIGTRLERGLLVKVGYSRNPRDRLATLQTAHGEPLQIFATIEGGKALEERYHRRWHTRRREGEWFIIGDCIIKEVERINKMKGTIPA